MSNLKFIDTRRQMRRSSNRLGLPREDGSLRGRPRRAQHNDRAAVSMALVGISRLCSANPFDKAGANRGCTDLPKGGGLFG